MLWESINDQWWPPPPVERHYVPTISPPFGTHFCDWIDQQYNHEVFQSDKRTLKRFSVPNIFKLRYLCLNSQRALYLKFAEAADCWHLCIGVEGLNSLMSKAWARKTSANHFIWAHRIPISFVRTRKGIVCCCFVSWRCYILCAARVSVTRLCIAFALAFAFACFVCFGFAFVDIDALVSPLCLH